MVCYFINKLKKKITISHLGDSRVYLIDKNLNIKIPMVDHNTANIFDFMFTEDKAMTDGFRIKSDDGKYTLAMTRSIGDKTYPCIKLLDTVELPFEDYPIIFAVSDGFYSQVEPIDFLKIALGKYKKNM